MTEDTPSVFQQILTGLLYGPPIWVWPLFIVLRQFKACRKCRKPGLRGWPLGCAISWLS